MSRITNDEATEPAKPTARCAGMTERRSCTFRPESWAGNTNTGYCAWHARVAGSPRGNTFEEFEQWCLALRAAHYCARWTHFTPLTLWEGMAGQRGHDEAQACAEASCPHHLVAVEVPF